ncbi:MBL fold metallo-hydrolase [Bacillus sp. FJAT-42376]|uniref:MBL fold metallo-hydrolase n=1 Tax=Bacillus sp. FJAT-42376 TaxID=2014076 RepID=UPI000F4DCD11|nr:MBL fold metallo-hydrolase [Bacillus sp. FJAT-42376]AZB42132.1 MBL fold metallo-hydrolase [Bacillus sp. FJAT-42376]
MEIRLIRNATLHVHYAGKTFLIDPFFAEKGAMPPFPNTPNQDQRNPLVSLPDSIEEIVKADAVLVTHLHPDHYDETAKQALPKELPLYAQNENDAEVLRQDGFVHAQSLGESISFGDITITKTSGQHGRGEITKHTGTVSGFVFSHPEEKTLYIAGDTVWCKDVEDAIEKHHPEVIFVNGGAAQYTSGDVITMDKEDIEQTQKAAPDAELAVIHMETLNHCLLTRAGLKEFLSDKEWSEKVSIPEDGETLQF